MVTMMKAPTTGPMMVPSPPTSAISTTSPDIAPLHVGQGGELQHHRLGGAGQPGQGGRQHEGQQLVAVDLVAQRHRALLVVADRLQHLAERRMDEAVDGAVAEQEDRQHDVIDRHPWSGSDRSQQLAARHPAGRPRRR